jgi:hypothetical protein
MNYKAEFHDLLSFQLAHLVPVATWINHGDTETQRRQSHRDNHNERALHFSVTLAPLWRQARLGLSARPSSGAFVDLPALLPGLDRRFLSAIAGLLRTQLEVRRVFQTVAPFEAVISHDPDYLPPFRREATIAATLRDPSDIHGKSCFVHRGSGRFSAVNAAPGATTAAARASVKGPLLGLRTKCAVDAWADAAPAHIAQSRLEPHAGVIIEGLEAFVAQRRRIGVRSTRRKNGDD